MLEAGKTKVSLLALRQKKSALRQEFACCYLKEVVHEVVQKGKAPLALTTISLFCLTIATVLPYFHPINTP